MASSLPLHRQTTQSGSGTQGQERRAALSTVIQIGSRQWPFHQTASSLPLHQTTRQLGSRTQGQERRVALSTVIQIGSGQWPFHRTASSSPLHLTRQSGSGTCRQRKQFRYLVLKNQFMTYLSLVMGHI